MVKIFFKFHFSVFKLRRRAKMKYFYIRYDIVLAYTRIFYLIIDLNKVPTEEKHMQVYNKGSNCTHIYNYLIFWYFNLQNYIPSSYNLYSLDQPANNGFVIVQSIGYSSLRGTNDSTGISTGVPARSDPHLV